MMDWGKEKGMIRDLTPKISERSEQRRTNWDQGTRQHNGSGRRK
jgi:hypothetical protein